MENSRYSLEVERFKPDDNPQGTHIRIKLLDPLTRKVAEALGATTSLGLLLLGEPRMMSGASNWKVPGQYLSRSRKLFPGESIPQALPIT